jgi:hypothetical protein
MKEELENELNELSPFLADLKKKQAGDAFKVPKFYFDNLADKIVAQAQTAPILEKTLSNKVKQPPQYWTRFEAFVTTIFSRKWAMAYASGALVAAAGWYALTRQTPIEKGVPTTQTVVTQTPIEAQMPVSIEPQASVNSTDIALNDVPKAAIQAYINDNLTDFDEALLLEHVPQLAEVSMKDASSPEIGTHTEEDKPKHPESGLTEEELELYLKEHPEDGDLDSSDNNL